ncbi:hypothetical protein NKH18_19335 [Streptomyces sp. M10(2022)]
MPRPTAAQLSYGSVTVVFSTLAMLLMSRASSGIAVALVCTAALALGLLVAVTVPGPKHSRTTPGAGRGHHAIEDIAGLDRLGSRIPAVRAAERVRERVGEHSLRR